MDYSKELTIGHPLKFSGTGVHTGKVSTVYLSPAPPGKGINFYKDNINIPVNLNNIENSQLCTKISAGNVSIGTVEHLLAAFHGLGISNIDVNVEGDEIPVLDGSAGNFVNVLKNELVEQFKPREFITLNKIIFIKEKDKFIMALPSSHLSVNYFLDYPKKFPGFIFSGFEYSPENFMEQIAYARTFGFLEDADFLQKNGLALGASHENTLVIEENGYSTALRYPNEPARHKILDLLGDLTFLGKNIKADIIAYKTGHQEHFKLIRKILQ